MNSNPRASHQFCASIFLLLSIVATTTKAATLQQPSIYFTENCGQWDERVLYKADGGAGLTWWFERDGLTLAVVVPDTTDASWRADFQSALDKRDAYPMRERTESPPSTPRKGHALKLRFVPSPSQSHDLVFARNKVTKQSQPATEVIPDGKLSWNNNYFLGNDSSKWAPDCGNFTRLTYRNVWDGIDVVYYGEGNQLKYDYIVKPGADPSNVRLRWLGLEEPLTVSQSGSPALSGGMESTTAGDGSPALSGGTESATAGDGGATELLLATSVGTLREGIPLAYQRGEDGARHPVEVSMRVLSENEFGLEVTGNWDRSKELVVDPVVYSTYLGGGRTEYLVSMDKSGNGNLAIGGRSEGRNYPITQDGQRNGNNNPDGVITIFNPDGEMAYSTYFGGAEEEYLREVKYSDDGSVFLAGRTGSDNGFPIVEGAFDASYNGAGDIFLTHFNIADRQLVSSTYLGGAGYEHPDALAIGGEFSSDYLRYRVG